MAQAASSAVLDGTLNQISSLVSALFVVRGQPATYASVASATLASITISAGLFTKADYSSGRQTTLASVAGSVTTTGTADHVVLADVGNSTIHFINTATQQALTAGNAITVNAFAIKISNPGQ